jgi:hypothetical protein
MVARKSANAVASATVEAVEAIDPIFEFQLEATPLDPEGAFERALEIAKLGPLSGPGWRLWPARFWQHNIRSTVFAVHHIIPLMSSLSPDRRISPAPDRLQ